MTFLFEGGIQSVNIKQLDQNNKIENFSYRFIHKSNFYLQSQTSLFEGGGTPKA